MKHSWPLVLVLLMHTASTDLLRAELPGGGEGGGCHSYRIHRSMVPDRCGVSCPNQRDDVMPCDSDFFEDGWDIEIFEDHIGSPDPDQMVGSGLADHIESLAADDQLFGLSGDDWLDGGDGDDELDGGSGDDLLIGGKGADTYRYRPGDGHDEIWDAEGDNRLVLPMVLAPSVVWAPTGDDLVLDLGDGSITIVGYYAGTSFVIDFE